ncbi:MAG: signal peptidase II [Acidobacteriaceae bacterium]
MSSKDSRGWLLLLSLLIIVADRITKWLAVTKIELGSHVIVIPHVFAISHVENPGAAFSLFNDSSSPGRVRWMLLFFSLLAAVAVLAALFKLGRKITPTSLALALILGGAVGNAWDRLRFGYVIDFLEVHIIHYHWPDFNVADSAIVVGGILLFFDALLSGKDSAPVSEPAIRNSHG